MMIKTVRILPLLITLFGVIFSTGCWNYREITHLDMVIGTGIDFDKKAKQVTITTQIVKPGEVKSPEADSGAGGGGKKEGGSNAVWVVKSTGDTVFDAVRNSAKQTSRKLFFSHNKVLILGKEAAESGVRPLLDFFIRDAEPRQTAMIIVADQKADEVLEQKVGDSKIPAMGIDSMLLTQFAHSQIISVNLQEFAGRLMSETSAPLCAFIDIINENGEKRLQIKKSAVFKNDKLVGELDKTEGRGLLWVIGKVKSGITLVRLPRNAGKISLEIIRAKSGIVPVLKQGQLKIKIYINTNSNIGEQTTSEEWTKPEKVRVLSKLQGILIKNEINAALKKARALKADIFGFGDAVQRKYPNEWEKMQKDWDRIFSALQVQIIINPKILECGMNMKPLTPPKQ
jgi:spore germination protein KC